ncbi:phosphatase PAP2 family protein [Wenzhouxiangella marina]|uniref:undecaprenyl-diphosphate phosphatase n=1 Tax=Wenzhouxiangella marina TaxID=1579979 RepID=A0A0K0XTI1_9GAMM|nr:phosphatase PAP2 family protein [Wenzhouxiangella marina]AKS40931.1 phosphoesterase PA-phosphatase [Wenzhouxiangella marina]MBB6087805.1 undecaprenyl-diphosphatase [Wenzhouxiangella marina]
MESRKPLGAATRLTTGFQRLDVLEARLCQPINAWSRQRWLRSMFLLVSRLGDGPLWYGLMLALPLVLGKLGLALSLQMMFGGLLGLSCYKLLKARTVRERPFASHPGIVCTGVPLDRYSFPSGHTLHAVLFGWLILSAVPALAPLLIPFVALIALSRIVLGLHYPSDVLIGATIGLLLARLVQALLPLAGFAPAA